MKQRSLVIILIPLFILTVLWVISNVYHSHVNSTISLPLLEQIVPIEGSFDTKTIEQIKTRTRVNTTDEVSAQVSGVPTPAISQAPTPSPVANQKSASTSAQTSPQPTVKP